MDVLVAIIAVLFGLIGILGSFLPALPGPPLAWVGLLMMYLWGGTNAAGEPMSLTILLVMLGVTVLVLVLDYVVPSWFTKLTGGSKYAGWGSMIGLVAGLILPLPVGMILASIIGAFLAELLFGGKNATDSLKSSLGAFLGFLFSSGLKIAACAVMMYYIIVYI